MCSLIYGDSIDEVLTMSRGGSTYYYHHDGLGSVTDLTSSTGAVVESYTYDVYGNVLLPSSIGNPYLFTGRRLDAESGIYYYRARMYSPTIGRFLQRDPLGYVDSMNLFSYVRNNPLNWIDPLGLCGEGLLDKIKDFFLRDSYLYGQAWQSFMEQMKIDFAIASTVAGWIAPKGILFERGAGILNNNPYFRIGWGWKGSRESGFELFRISIGQKGSKFHLHFDFWNLFRR